MTSLAGRRWVQRLRRLVTGVPFLVTAAVVVSAQVGAAKPAPKALRLVIIGSIPPDNYQ